MKPSGVHGKCESGSLTTVGNRYRSALPQHSLVGNYRGELVRLFVWLVGVGCSLEALMTARAIAPAWAWLWWCFLGLWFWVGAMVLIMAMVRVASSGVRGRELRAPAPPKGED